MTLIGKGQGGVQLEVSGKKFCLTMYSSKEGTKLVKIQSEGPKIEE